MKRLIAMLAALSLVATLGLSLFGMVAAEAKAKPAKTSCLSVKHQVQLAKATVITAVRDAKDSKGKPNEDDAMTAVKKTKTKLSKAKKHAATCAKQAKAAAKAAVPQKTPDQCVEGYNVVFDEHEGNKVVSHAQAELPMDNPQKALQLLMQYSQHDPSILMLYWNSSPLGKDEQITDWAVLIDDGCYTSAARDKFHELVGMFKSATVVSSPAPAVGVNTGVQQAGNVPFQEMPGPIDGDRTAIKITFANGDVIWIMKRCGNVVKESPVPGVPTKPVPPPNVPPSPCPIPPIGVPPEFWDTVNCKKLDSNFDFQQNVSPARQDPQSNPCCYTGPTPGAPASAPAPATPGPTPVAGTPAPAPLPDGTYTAPVAPGGSTGTPDGDVSGGGPVPPGTTIPVDTGDHTTDSGGF